MASRSSSEIERAEQIAAYQRLRVSVFPRKNYDSTRNQLAKTPTHGLPRAPAATSLFAKGKPVSIADLYRTRRLFAGLYGWGTLEVVPRLRVYYQKRLGAARRAMPPIWALTLPHLGEGARRGNKHHKHRIH